ncbi:helix-turn-helix transcriptional regulator [Chitinibacter tainanensis]|uniref:helix-turn-helix transcriptional regulator n=1 Tax=Chitinibacter tainanensis TaxID=230667 RepID=UPI0003F8AF15|nr:response regulator transcription factor [Chitinibacter tainanensis]
MSQLIYLLSQDASLLKHWQQAWGERCQPVAYPLPDLAPDSIVVLDTQHPACQIVEKWRTALQRYASIATSTVPSDEQGHQWLSMGARGYCHALAPNELLQQVMAVVSAGEIWAGRSLVQRILAAINHLPAQQAPDLSALSERELETARYAAKGYANKEIARFLNISERTVKAHLTSCYEKLGIADRVQLTLRLNGLN